MFQNFKTLDWCWVWFRSSWSEKSSSCTSWARYVVSPCLYYACGYVYVYVCVSCLIHVWSLFLSWFCSLSVLVMWCMWWECMVVSVKQNFQRKFVCVYLGLITPVTNSWNTNRGRDQSRHHSSRPLQENRRRKFHPEVVTPVIMVVHHYHGREQPRDHCQALLSSLLPHHAGDHFYKAWSRPW